eukprot:3735213-Prymnesium_polylepis.2
MMLARVSARASKLLFATERVRNAASGAASAACGEQVGAAAPVVVAQVAAQTVDARQEASRLCHPEAQVPDQALEILKVLPAVLLARATKTRFGALQSKAVLAQVLEHLRARYAQLVRHNLAVLLCQLLWPQRERLCQLWAIDETVEELDLLGLEPEGHHSRRRRTRSPIGGSVDSSDVDLPPADAKRRHGHLPQQRSHGQPLSSGQINGRRWRHTHTVTAGRDPTFDNTLAAPSGSLDQQTVQWQWRAGVVAKGSAP